MTDYAHLLAACDHTLLDRCATAEDIIKICDEGIEYGTATVCIPPCYVKSAKEYVCERLKICTVIGFPNGYSSTEAKVLEAECAVRDGADEIDAVINLGYVKSRRFDLILNEINEIKKVCGSRTLKIIIEACYLTEDEKIEMCDLISASDADFIKTSTGFGSGGATLDDIKLIAGRMKNGKHIKAAGGISSICDAEAFIRAGADRIGTSRLINLIKSAKERGTKGKNA